VNRTPEPVPSLRRTTPVAVAEPGHYTCILCPACGTETCKTLQDLGMYCDTICAATEAMRGESRRKRKLAVV